MVKITEKEKRTNKEENNSTNHKKKENVFESFSLKPTK